MKQPTALARTTLVSLLCAVMLGCQRNATAESEIKALQFIKALHAAQTRYHNQNGRYGDLQALEATDRNLIAASDLARAAESGYQFHIDASASAYSVTALHPDATNDALHRSFYSDESGEIRARLGGPPASATSPTVR
jgi:hypothetical protein